MINWKLKIDDGLKKRFLIGELENITIKIYPLRWGKVMVKINHEQGMLSNNFDSVTECLQFVYEHVELV